jgi:hypothetical protein
MKRMKLRVECYSGRKADERPVRLTQKGALVREGERRHARYKLGVPLRPVPHISLNERGELIEE